VFYGQGDYSAAAPLFERALAIQERALSPDHPTLAATLNNLANLRKAQKNYLAARQLLQRALAIRERTLGPEHPDVAWSVGDLGVLMREQGDYTGAEGQFRRALAIFERTDQQDGVAWTLNDLGLLNQRRGDAATAESYYQRAIETFESKVSKSHPDLAEFLDNYAALLRQTGRASEAEPLAKRAASIRDGQPATPS
jgi:tetratricopeptide (TPR) repeat protein